MLNAANVFAAVDSQITVSMWAYGDAMIPTFHVFIFDSFLWFAAVLVGMTRFIVNLIRWPSRGEVLSDF